MKRLLPIILICFLLASCSRSSRPASISTAQPPPEPQVEEPVEPQITGPPEFQEDVKNALALIKEKAPEHYKLSCDNVLSIDLSEAHPEWEAWVNSVIIYISKVNYDKYRKVNPYYLHILLAHETTHVVQFRQGRLKTPREEREREALAAEREILLKLDCPEHIIKQREVRWRKKI